MEYAVETFSNDGRETSMLLLKKLFLKFVRFTFRNVGIVGLILVYTMTGAYLFMYLEDEVVEKNASDSASSKYFEDFVERLWNVTLDLNILYKENWTSLVNKEMLRFQMRIVDQLHRSNSLSVSQQNKWSLSGGILYSLTIITTIGYDHIAPRTPWGKLCTILYAMFGIPLFLLYLATIGDILAKSFKWIYCRVFFWFINHTQIIIPFQYITELETGNVPDRVSKDIPQIYENCESKSKIRQICKEDMDSDTHFYKSLYSDNHKHTVPISLSVLIIISYIIVGALLFSNWESEWNLLEGSYFCFISLSTIGLGDFFPGQMNYKKNEKIVEQSLIFCSLYLLLGMALLAMCFNLIQEEVFRKIRDMINYCGLADEIYGCFYERQYQA